VVAVLIIWVFLPDRDGDWKPYTLDSEFARLEAKYAILDGENAAIIYNELFMDDAKYKEPPTPEWVSELLKKGESVIQVDDVNELLSNFSYSTFYPEFWNQELDDLTRYDPWKSQEYPQVSEWLNERKYIIEKLTEASRVDKCKFPIPLDPLSMKASVEKLVPMRRWTSLLICATNNDIADGRFDDAIKKLTTLLQMSKHLNQHPTLMMTDLLAALRIESEAFRQINVFIVKCNLSEDHLAAIENKLTTLKQDWKTDWPRYLDTEKLLGKNSICSMVYEINGKGKIRFSRNPFTAACNTNNQIKTTTYWQKKHVKAGIILSWFYMPSTPQKVSQFIDSAYQKLYEMADPNFDWSNCERESEYSRTLSTSTKLNYESMLKLYALMQEPLFYRIYLTYMKTISQLRGTQLIIALKRYKYNTPGNLDQWIR
jgi:hypothetical protein